MEKIHYPFKTLENLFERDAPVSGEIETYHEAIRTIVLHNGVPCDVTQLFETAKNISLYSYFAYRLHQPAEMTGLSAFEMALRSRAKTAYPNLFLNEESPMLYRLTQLAITDKWFKGECFSHLRKMAYARAQRLKDIELIKRMMAEGLTEAECEEPSDEEVALSLKEIDFAESFLHSLRHTRNYLAHGSSHLMPSSIRTLHLLSEAINQLFSE